MSNYFWVHGVESDCSDCLSAINTYFGLPRTGTDKWAEKQKADGEDLWFYPDGTYVREVDGEWGQAAIEDALSGVTLVELDDPADMQEVLDEATTGKAVRVTFDQAIEFGFWPEEVGGN